jgi:hypothetical protein
VTKLVGGSLLRSSEDVLNDTTVDLHEVFLNIKGVAHYLGRARSRHNGILLDIL